MRFQQNGYRALFGCVGSCVGLMLFVLLGATVAGAELLRLRVDTIEPFAEGASFGEAGSYERVVGVAIGELDPDAPHNAEIALLDMAQRNERGRVEYEIDFFILRPTEGSDVLLYDVTKSIETQKPAPSEDHASCH